MGTCKVRKPLSPPKNASPRRLRSAPTAAAESPLSETFQKPSKTFQELIDRPRKAQKRKTITEDEHSQKRLRKYLPSVSLTSAVSQDSVSIWHAREEARQHDPEDKDFYNRCQGSVPEPQLSEDNLKELERDLEYLERDSPYEMDPGIIALNRVRKRTPSQRTSVSDLNKDTASQRSQKSSVSN